jgi:hypothetical protein
MRCPERLQNRDSARWHNPMLTRAHARLDRLYASASLLHTRFLHSQGQEPKWLLLADSVSNTPGTGPFFCVAADSPYVPIAAFLAAP